MKFRAFALLTSAMLFSTAPRPVAAQLKQATSPSDMGQKLQQLGTREPDAKTASDVRDALARAINLSMTVDKFPDLIGQLARPDRDRIGTMPRENYDHLNKAIAQLRQDFQDKYHQEFSMPAQLLSAAQITLGMDDKTLTVSLPPPAKTPALKSAGESAATTRPADQGANAIQQKTGLAVVNGPTVSLINEAGPGAGQAPAWKFDIPNEITGRQLKETLTRHLEKIDDQKAAWTDDPSATRHAVASAVLQALTEASIAVDQ